MGARNGDEQLPIIIMFWALIRFCYLLPDRLQSVDDVLRRIGRKFCRIKGVVNRWWTVNWLITVEDALAGHRNYPFALMIRISRCLGQHAKSSMTICHLWIVNNDASRLTHQWNVWPSAGQNHCVEVWNAEALYIILIIWRRIISAPTDRQCCAYLFFVRRKVNPFTQRKHLFPLSANPPS